MKTAISQPSSGQKVMKLRAKNLEEFNSQQSEQENQSGKRKDKTKRLNREGQEPLLVPKLLLDKVKS